MPDKKTCFVIIGYGSKNSYADGKVRALNLDETYEDLILPVFTSLNIDCYRAIDKNLTGSIDKVMLREIRNADLALVDISTLNANVMWELGVRHALKPHHTIMICEKKQMGELPFDINHFPIHEYVHTEYGIPNREIGRFRDHLKNVVNGVLSQDTIEVDSPVHVFLKDEMTQKEELNDNGNSSFASLLSNAETAKKNEDYKTAIQFFQEAKEIAEGTGNLILRDNLSFIICRIALCTYKYQQPDEKTALLNAKKIINQLDPEKSHQIEVLGLSGAINKRLYEVTGELEYLEKSIKFYESGYYYKQDYYNGINAAFMLYQKTSLLIKENKDWDETKIEADFLRNKVLKIVKAKEAEPDFESLDDAVWILLTIAEVYYYKGDTDNCTSYEEKAKNLAEEKNDSFAIASYFEQKEKITKVFEVIDQ